MTTLGLGPCLSSVTCKQIGYSSLLKGKGDETRSDAASRYQTDYLSFLHVRAIVACLA